MHRSPSGPSRTVLLVTTLAVAALAMTGCSSKDDSPTKASPDENPASSTPSQAVTDPVDEPTDEADPTPTQAPPATLADRLLPTSSVPGLNATWRWEDGETGPADDAPFSLCAKVDLASIGATEVVERSYFPPVDTDDNAGEQIAEFPDATTTATALKVLKSWHKRCSAPRLKVGALTSVPGGSWYLVTKTSPNSDDGLFQAVGLVTSGTRIAVLTIDLVGQDYNYPAGKEPMVAMVKAAAARLA